MLMSSAVMLSVVMPSDVKLSVEALYRSSGFKCLDIFLYLMPFCIYLNIGGHDCVQLIGHQIIKRLD
jgi:hypothetical protein